MIFSFLSLFLSTCDFSGHVWLPSVRIILLFCSFDRHVCFLSRLHVYTYARRENKYSICKSINNKMKIPLPENKHVLFSIFYNIQYASYSLFKSMCNRLARREYLFLIIAVWINLYKIIHLYDSILVGRPRILLSKKDKKYTVNSIKRKMSTIKTVVKENIKRAINMSCTHIWLMIGRTALIKRSTFYLSIEFIHNDKMCVCIFYAHIIALLYVNN
jgi:hypothetical protein